MRATSILPAGHWSAASQSVTLDSDRRFRRRLRFTTDQGREILLDLPDAIHIRGGDALSLEDGTCVEVHAAREALLEITAPSADALIRLISNAPLRDRLGVAGRDAAERSASPEIVATKAMEVYERITKGPR